jgi:CRP-like cAMP-binding protein
MDRMCVPGLAPPLPFSNRISRHRESQMSNAHATIEAVRPVRAFDASAFLRSAGGRTATYQRSDVIFSQDEAADSLFYIQEGAVKLSVLSRSGKEGVVAILESGDFFGESALANGPVRSEVATALTATTVLIIPTEQMIKLLRADHGFSSHFIAHMLARNLRMESDLVDQLLNSTEKRLARTLLLLARSGKPGKASGVLPNISQATLADMVGSTRSRVNVLMNRFKTRGFIEDDGGLKVHDSLLTVVLRDETSEDPESRPR